MPSIISDYKEWTGMMSISLSTLLISASIEPANSSGTNRICSMRRGFRSKNVIYLGLAKLLGLREGEDDLGWSWPIHLIIMLI